MVIARQSKDGDWVSTDDVGGAGSHPGTSRGVATDESGSSAVIGYDDIPYAACTQGPLTTVAVPKRPLGEMSAELLLDRFDGPVPPEPRQVLLPPEFVIRASCP